MFNLFAAFVSYIYFGYTNNSSRYECTCVFPCVCVHIICIHLLPMGNKRNDGVPVVAVAGWSFRFTWVHFILSIANVLRFAFMSFSLPFAIC